MSQFSNGKQSIPNVFKEIIANDAERSVLKSQKIISVQDVGRYRRLREDRVKNLVPAAEQLLRWNTDKGNRAQ